MAARGETQADVEVSTLVVPAWRLRWRAPELALVLGERAVALATSRHDEADRLRAESLVVFAGNRVGHGVRIADRALDALKAAEAAGEYETAWLLRVELAACARSVGAPLTGFAAVTPVLEAPDVPAELRASALVQASECLVTVGRGDEPTQALAEADQLYVADTTLDEDMRLVLRGLIRAVQAAQHRRWGDIAAAVGAAREGLDLLSRLIDMSADSGQAHGRLTLELVLALMDANCLLDASEIGSPILERPVRAPSASTSGWLRLALATRVHLPAGRVALARDMLRDAAVSAERHQLDTLLAESLLALAHVHEVSGELADALTNLRSAHAAERRRARGVYAVRARLAAEFSGVHRQPADLHRQLADLLRPIEGMPKPADGVLPAALKQQLRQWRPVQVRKGDGLKVKRVRRAAEDMTVEGLSAARAHAADRWRMVQPFGEPEDKTPEPVEPPPTPQTDRTVPASGLIASAGAMVSGRRRAARVAAGEIDESQPTTTPTEAEAPQLSPEQERRRKVEQQLMELQREARRQIEAERQARAEERAKAEREAQQAAEEAARQAAAREEAARQAAAREEAARQEAAREQAARAEAARREAERQEAQRAEAAQEQVARAESQRSSSPQSESVLDMLRAQGLRTGGRRRARDADAQPETPSWRVDPPSRRRQEDHASAYSEAPTPPEPAPSYFSEQATPAARTESSSPNFFADASAPDATRTDSSSPQDHFERGAHSAAPDRPTYLADPGTSAAPAAPDAPDRPGRSGLAAAFSRPPAAPDFGPHVDDPVPGLPAFGTAADTSPQSSAEPAYPLSTPATGFPASSAEPKLPDLDFSSLDFGDMNTRSQTSAPRWSTASVPSPNPAEHPDPAQPDPAKPDPERKPDRDPKPLPPIPDPVPSVPVPDEIPQLPEQPDLLSNSFLSAADVDDDIADFPTGRFTVQSAPNLPAAEPYPGAGDQPAWATRSAPTESGRRPGHAAGADPDHATRPEDAEPRTQTLRAIGTDFEPADGLGQTGASAHIGPNPRDEPIDQAASGGPVDTVSLLAQTPPADAATAQPATADDEPATGAFKGRPSSRRKPSDLSLADLLAEALVAYETGRRSDEEQFEATELAASQWSAADAEQPPDPAQPPTLESTPEPVQQFALERPSTPDQLAAERHSSLNQRFAPEQREASDQPSGLDQPPAPGRPLASDRPFGLARQSDSEPPSVPGQPFGLVQRSDSGPSSVPDQPSVTDRPFDFGQRSDSEQPSMPVQPFAANPPFAFNPQFGADSRFGGDRQVGAHRQVAPDQRPASDQSPSLEQPTPRYQPAAVQPASQQSVPQQSAVEQSVPEQSTPESAAEKTGPIVPVGAAPDSETTGPIRRVQSDGGGWTLPGT